MPNLVARPLSAKALADLIDRKPHLLRPLAAQLLPLSLPSINPTKHLGIDLSSLRTAEDVRQMLAAVLAALARGKFAPAEGARIAVPALSDASVDAAIAAIGVPETLSGARALLSAFAG